MMNKKETINVKGTEIVFMSKAEEDYFSLQTLPNIEMIKIHRK